jgi:hypothetical protein
MPVWPDRFHNHKTGSPSHENLPGSWWPARRLARERFLAIEASSGILLLADAAVALIRVNSPWRERDDALWHVPFGLSLGSFSFERDLHCWINDRSAPMPSRRRWSPSRNTPASILAVRPGGASAIQSARKRTRAESPPTGRGTRRP